MNEALLADFIKSLLMKSSILPGRDIEARMIANPRAGGFTRPRIGRRHMADMALLAAEASGLEPRRTGVSLSLQLTERRGHAFEMTRALLDVPRSGAALLLIAAGGDGTSHEIQSAMMEADAARRADAVVLRLPMGTGNDGSDGRSLVASLGRLLKPSRIEPMRAIRISAPGIEGARYAFNIASVGLDAYVTHMTNKLKGFLPGDSYKLWLDIASVFYDRTFRVEEMDVRYRCEDGERTRKLAYELVAMGVTGHRTYGSNVLILPDDDNVCAVRKTSIARKIAIKGAVAKASHRGMEEIEFFRADRVEIRYGGRVLTQFDGETLLLEPGNFPFVMELTEPAIRTIARA
jgi:diacylglycerol kinase family enzyme